MLRQDSLRIRNFIQDSLFLVLQRYTTRQSLADALDEMYTQFLQHSVIVDFNQDKEELLERSRPIVRLSDPLNQAH
jgi:hypothetical protein